MNEGTSGEETRHQFASQFFLRRLMAIAIDMALAFGALYLLERSAPDGMALFDSERSDITKNALFSLYMLIAAWIGHGKTPGKKLAGLRVVNTDGTKASLNVLMMREFVGRLAVEKINLLMVYLLNALGLMEAIRAHLTLPLSDFAVTALISLPWLTFVSCAFALCRPDGRTLHDLVSGTMIVKN